MPTCSLLSGFSYEIYIVSDNEKKNVFNSEEKNSIKMCHFLRISFPCWLCIRCGTHSTAQGYIIEQDLTKDYPDCCAKLVRAERKFKRVDVIDASAVKISKFKGRFGGKKIDAKDIEPTTTLASVMVDENIVEKDPLKVEEEGETTEQTTELSEWWKMINKFYFGF